MLREESPEKFYNQVFDISHVHVNIFSGLLTNHIDGPVEVVFSFPKVHFYIKERLVVKCKISFLEFAM